MTAVIVSPIVSDALGQLLWIWVLGIFAVAGWSLWAGVVRPFIDRRWPGAVDRAIDALLPLPFVTRVVPSLTPALIERIASTPVPPTGALRLVHSDASPKPALSPKPSEASKTASPASSLEFSRALSASVHVDAIARELYFATVSRVLNADGDRVQVAGLVFEQLPPRVREAYRAAAEVAIRRLDAAAHMVAVTAACSFAPNFPMALERYHYVLRHQPTPAAEVQS